MSYAGKSKSMWQQRSESAGKAPTCADAPKSHRGKVAAFLRVYGFPLIVTLVAIAGSAYFLWPDSPAEEAVEVGKFGKRVQLNRDNLRKTQSPRDAVRDAMKSVKMPGKRHANRAKPILAKVMFDHLNPEDRRLAEKLQAALDSDNLEATIKAAEAALLSKTPEVRQNAVDALGWFGPEALPELTGAMADADPNVAQAAGNAWELGVADLPDPADRIEIVAATMASLSDPDQLVSIAGHFTCAVTEYVDMEEDEKVAAERRQAVVQLLVDIIEGSVPKACVEGAKEAYSDVTGEDWQGIEAAEGYLREQYDYEADAQGNDNDEIQDEVEQPQEADVDQSL